ncbi:MAG: AAA family ATPase [Candidatus Aminicenantes bacterium]|nr:AAA family ATPase [Candidatus Aminicenantes bacterium]
MYITRDLEEKIRSYLDKPEIIAIIGPRQSGKTTLMKEIFKSLSKAVYIDFEDRDTLSLFNNDIKSFYELHVMNADYLFIDEFQYAKEGGQKLKYLFDTHKLKIIISGSSVLDLTHQAIKFLVGRIFVFYLYPFNFGEYLRFRDFSLFKNIYADIKFKTDGYLRGEFRSLPSVSDAVIKRCTKYYQEFVVYGGFPRVVLAENEEEKITILKNIYNTYFLREIRDILQLSTEEKMQKLIKALSLQVGSMVVFKELSQLTTLRYEKLLDHLSILEKTFVIKRVLPYCTNKRIEIAKTPKIFFLDNGFRNIVINNFQKIGDRIDRGILNENFIASQLLKSEYDFNFWRTKAGAEVDFILEAEAKLAAIEVKSTLHSMKVSKAMISFQKKYSPRRIVVTSEGYFDWDKKRNIAFLPNAFI